MAAITAEMMDQFFQEEGVGWFDESGQWYAEKPAYVNGTSADPNTLKLKASQRRARAYVAKMPPAVAGQRGHDATFRVACELILGFGLTIHESLDVIREYNQRCQPPWSEAELLHKLRDADKRPGRRGVRLAWKDDDSVGTPLPGWVQTDAEIAPPHRDKPSAFPLDAFPPALQTYASCIANM